MNLKNSKQRSSGILTILSIVTFRPLALVLFSISLIIASIASSYVICLLPYLLDELTFVFLLVLSFLSTLLCLDKSLVTDSPLLPFELRLDYLLFGTSPFELLLGVKEGLSTLLRAVFNLILLVRVTILPFEPFL